MTIRMDDKRSSPAGYIRTHQQVVYTFCYRSTGDAVRAQKLAQEIIALGWQNQEKTPALTYQDEKLRLLILAYKRCLRSLANRPSFDAAGEHGYQAVKSNCQENIQQLLYILPAQCRCLFILHKCCALSLDEIARVTTLPQSLVDAHLVHAYRLLAGKLQQLANPGPIEGEISRETI